MSVRAGVGYAWVSGVVLSLWSPGAQAHISVSAAKPAVAASTQVLTFSVGHGCEGADTTRIEVSIPEGVGGVRPLDSVFGKARLTRDPATQRVTAVSWTKAEADILPEDTQLYALSMRVALPDVPFTTLFFPTVQTCRKADGTVLTARWVAASTEHDHAGGSGSASELPAPALFVLPPRTPGWNKYTVTQHVHDLSVFQDAQIVWSGTAAYSPSAYITGLIAQESGTQVLKEIHPDTDIWVRY